MKNTYSSKNRFATENDQKLEEAFFQFLAGIPGQAPAASQDNKASQKEFNKERKDETMFKREPGEKLLIAVIGPTCSGKTTASYNMAMACSKAGMSVAFGDKDTMYAGLSSIVCKDRQSKKFYELGIRDAEMEALGKWALEAMIFSNTLIITAPYSKEIGIAFDGGVSHRFAELKRKANQRGGQFVIVYNSITLETAVDRWIDRYNSNKEAFNRTKSMPHTYEELKAKLAENASYYDRTPENTAVNERNCNYFHIFNGNSPEKAFEDLKNVLGIASSSWRYYPQIADHYKHKFDDYEDLD